MAYSESQITTWTDSTVVLGTTLQADLAQLYANFPFLAKLAGRSGGQTLVGGTGTGEDLKLTSNTSKDGLIQLGDTDQYDENTGELKVNYMQYRSYLGGGYAWTAWNPSDVVGTPTNAPGTGTALTATDYAAMVNSSGTVTTTFTKAGRYLITINVEGVHGEAYTLSRVDRGLGGTATRLGGTATMTTTDDSASNQNNATGISILVTATANQTLTILPSFLITGGASTANHTAYCNMTFLYIGG